MTDLPQEVRRCARCGQAKLIATAAWEHRHYGIRTGTFTTDLRCQGCGQRVTLQSKQRILGTNIAGVLLIPTCMGPLILGLAWWWKQQGVRNPVVPDAPPVVRRFQDGPPKRRCGKCGEVAWAKTITRNRHNGVPTGTEYGYLCGGCQAEFTVESPWGHIFSAMAGSLCVLISVLFLIYGEGPGWRFGGGGVLGLLALFVVGQNAVRLLRRVKNPVLTDAPADIPVMEQWPPQAPPPSP